MKSADILYWSPFIINDSLYTEDKVHFILDVGLNTAHDIEYLGNSISLIRMGMPHA